MNFLVIGALAVSLASAPVTQQQRQHQQQHHGRVWPNGTSALSYEYLLSKYMGPDATPHAHVAPGKSLPKAPPHMTQFDPKHFDAQLSKYWKKYPAYATLLKGLRLDGGGNVSNSTAALAPPASLLRAAPATAAAQGPAFVEVGAQIGTGVGAATDGCEVCVYVISNKELHQPFLCRGLKQPQQQETCVSVLVSLIWWLENQVYWVNYGCQKSSESSQWEWVKPCPAHAICNFIQSLYDRTPFCPADPMFRKPSA